MLGLALVRLEEALGEGRDLRQQLGACQQDLARQIESTNILAKSISEAAPKHKATQAERDELREAGRALVADLESDEGHWPGWCDHPRCRRLFTLTDGKGCTCDEHQGDLIAERLQDCSYTPALRRLMGTKKEGA